MRLKPCKQAGCRNNTTNRNRYCDEHQQNARNNKRSFNADSKRFYNSASWEHTRKQKLEENPLCEICSTEDHPVAATLVHHKDSNIENNKLSNLQSLCHSCHEIEHARKKPTEEYIIGNARGARGIESLAGTPPRPEKG